MIKRIAQVIGAVFSIVSIFALWRWWQIRRGRIPAPQAFTLVRNPDTVLSLRRDGETLSVEWSQTSQRTELYLAPTTKALQRDQATIIIENQNFAILHGIDPTTRYQVEITLDDGTTHHQFERVLPLNSVTNFRDIGGYKTKDGATVKWNRVYRSSALDNLTVQDSKHLEELGIKLVCDVRTVEEQVSNPDQVADHIELLSLPVSSNDNVWMGLFRILFQQHFLENLLLDLYQRVMIEENPQVFKSIFERIGEEQNLPMLIHCAAGKDRTGVAIALLLAFLAVPDETIVADYTLSNHYYSFFKRATRKSLAQLRIMGLTEGDFDYLLIADGTIIQKTLDAVRHKYGTIEQYLIAYVGIATETLEAIRHNMLD